MLIGKSIVSTIPLVISFLYMSKNYLDNCINVMVFEGVICEFSFLSELDNSHPSQ